MGKNLDINQRKSFNIKRIRLQFNLKQRQIAEIIHMRESNVSDMENNRRTITDKVITMLCNGLKIDPSEFLIKPDIDIEELPNPKKEVMTKLFQMTKDMETEAIRDVLKYAEKEKLWTDSKMKQKNKAS